MAVKTNQSPFLHQGVGASCGYDISLSAPISCYLFWFLDDLVISADEKVFNTLVV